MHVAHVVLPVYQVPDQVPDDSPNTGKCAEKRPFDDGESMDEHYACLES